MSLRFGWMSLTLATGLVLQACPADQKESPKPGTAEKPPEQPPSSQPSSASSLPEGHSTSSAAATLNDVFRMPETPEDVVLVVNETKLMRADLEDRLREVKVQMSALKGGVSTTRYEVLKGAVDTLTDRAIREQLAIELNATAEPAQIDSWLNSLKQRMDADPAFKAFLMRAGKDEVAMRKDAREAVLMINIANKLKEQVKEQTEDEAHAYYKKHIKDYIEHGGIQTWRIFFKAPRGLVQRDRDIAKARAEDIQAKAAKDPNNFENLAKSHSEGGNAVNGGYIGYVAKGTLAADIEKLIYDAKPNTVLPIYEDAVGFYVYKVGEKRETRTRPFEEVKDRILTQTYRNIITKRVDAALARLRKERKIEIRIPEYSKLEAEVKARVAERQEKLRKLEERSKSSN